MANVLSIDAGTTGITVMVIDPSGDVIARAYTEFPQHFPKPGWVEHDPEEIWQAVQTVVGQARQQVDRIDAIGITNQRETTVVWEKGSLKPVHNAIVWQCRRSAEVCDELRAAGAESEIRERTGLVVDAYFSGTKLTWLLREHPDLRPPAESGDLAFGTIDSWLIAKLTNGAVHATDPSNASRTLLYNIHDLEWDPRLAEILEVPMALLGEVRPSSGEFGEATLSGVEGVPIRGVAGDQQSALFGQACFSPGMSKNTYGTGSFVLTNTGGSHRISPSGLLTSVGWQIGSDYVYASEGAIFITGAAIQWLRDGLKIIDKASDTEPVAASVDSTEGVHLVPAFVGLGAPHWDPRATGIITGITRGTTRAHIVRAAVEAMALQTFDVVEAMQSDSGVELTELRVDGGASVMDLLCQFQSDLLQVPVARPAIRETTAMGAAYLAGLSAGVWSTQQEVASHWKLDRRFEPSISTDQRDEAVAAWRAAVARSLSG